MNLKSLKNKLSKLEQVKRKMAIEADCICFPPDQPPVLLLQAEREAASGVLCPVHGQRFSKFAGPLIYREVIPIPAHLDLSWQTWRSPQYIKAMDASFPSDRWPATKVVEPDGVVRFVLKDGTEIHRSPPPTPVYGYDSGEIVGFLEGYPRKFKAISTLDSGLRDREQP